MFASLFFAVFVQLLYHIRVSSAFQINCPSTANVGEQVDCTWIRNNGDDSSFGLLLHPTSQDQTGTVVQTIRDTTQDQATFPVTFDHPDQFIIEVVPPDTDRRTNIKASSSTINAVSSGNSGSGTSSSTISNDGNTNTVSNNGAATSTTSAVPSSTSSADANTQTSQVGVFNPGFPVIKLPETDSSSSPQPTPAAFVPSSGASGAIPVSAATNPATVTATQSFLSTLTLNPAGPTSINPSQPSSFPQPSSDSKGSKLPLIMGLTFGILAFLLVILSLLYTYSRSRRRKQTSMFWNEKMVRNGRGRGLVFDVVSPFGTLKGGKGENGAEVSDMVEKGGAQGVGTNVNVGTGASAALAALSSTAGGQRESDIRSVSEYSYRTSRSESLDPKIAMLWQNARERVSGLSRSNTAVTKSTQAGLVGTSGSGAGGSPLPSVRESSEKATDRATLSVSQSHDSAISGYSEFGLSAYGGYRGSGAESGITRIGDASARSSSSASLSPRGSVSISVAHPTIPSSSPFGLPISYSAPSLPISPSAPIPAATLAVPAAAATIYQTSPRNPFADQNQVAFPQIQDQEPSRQSAYSASSGSSEPSVFYTAVPKGPGEGNSLAVPTPAQPAPTTIKERLAPWFTFPPRPQPGPSTLSPALATALSPGSSIDRPPPDASLPTSVNSTWNSNMGRYSNMSPTLGLPTSPLSVSSGGIIQTSAGSPVSMAMSPTSPNPNQAGLPAATAQSSYGFPTQRILGLFPPSAATWTTTASNWATNLGVRSGMTLAPGRVSVDPSFRDSRYSEYTGPKAV
ncbi:hypothetical protein VKT23_002771 [Stygiomarasmius scandens]|uniref:Uncharacterized protein n=1 Tax=Marasmiellus scandens TaxID=2682957 RepID=A0ABR1JXN8_9AGAR